MISLSSATRIFIVTGATDMRKSFNGLYGIVAHRLHENPMSGHVFVFCNASRNRLKLLLWDGSGLWVCAKRLERGRFSWDWTAEETSAVVTHEYLSLLLGGIDLKGATNKRWLRLASGGEKEGSK